MEEISVPTGGYDRMRRRDFTAEEEAALFDFDVNHESVPMRPKEAVWLVAATVLSCRKFNVRAFIDTILGVWKPFRGAEGRSIADNLFIFEFHHQRDMQKVLNDGPWHFNNQLIVLKEVSSESDVTREDLRFCRFWIQVLNLSSYQLSAVQAHGLGSQLGHFIAYDEGKTSGGRSGCVRLRVEIDISKPIRRGILTLQKGRQLWYDVRYEKLPNYCFWCGGFDHVEKDCIAAFEEEAGEEDERRFANLKAEPLRNVYLKVANAQRWSECGSQRGPRFVHRQNVAGSRPNNAQAMGNVEVVEREKGLVNSEFGASLEDRSVGELDPVIAHSLNDLSITPLSTNVLVDRIVPVLQTQTNEHEIVASMEKDQLPQISREACCPLVSEIMIKLITQLAPATSKDLGTDMDSVEMEACVLDKGEASDLGGRVLAVSGEWGRDMDRLNCGERILGGVPQAELAEEPRDACGGIGSALRQSSAIACELPLCKLLSSGSLRKWKRRIRESQTCVVTDSVSVLGKREASGDLTEEKVVDGKKNRQVDADIPVNSTAGPGFQACRSQ